MIGKLRRIAYRMKHRNGHLLNEDSWKVREKRVNLHWWKRTFDGNRYNLGDWLSTIIVDQMLERRGLSQDTEVSRTKHLAAVGSVLLWQHAYQDITVWGSGLLTDGLAAPGQRLRNFVLHRLMHRVDVRSVRGPETRRMLKKIGIRCPEIYGDPGILISEFYRPQIGEVRDYNVIPHFSDKELYQNNPAYVDIVTDDWQSTIDRICSSKLNVCGSLHALIISESYGIPAILMLPAQTGKKKPISLFKYQDYYYGTGRMVFPVAEDLASALQMMPPELPELKDIKQRLMEVFPYDLWK